jgi:hypothetical protein
MLRRHPRLPDSPPGMEAVMADLDVVIIGGSASGLWLLDVLSREGYSALLLEAKQLGSGQTVASQGIIHGGVKYMLAGLPTPAARSIRKMPDVWRRSLEGNSAPNLRATRVRADYCHLWQTRNVRSRLGMLAARLVLRTRPRTLSQGERPIALQHCPGTVARVDEQVIAPRSFIADLFAQHQRRILWFDPAAGLDFQWQQPAHISGIRLRNPDDNSQPNELRLMPKTVVLTAGAGNAQLRELAGLAISGMQRRPLHMVMVRGALPDLNGHCTDGARTRVTITADVDSSGRRVWQVGGHLAEQGVGMDEEALLLHARAELRAVLPDVDFAGCEWTAYQVDRAEGAMALGLRPNSVQVLQDGNLLTCWPTKLALVPQLAQAVRKKLDVPMTHATLDLDALSAWPRPQVAVAPWEEPRNWRLL